MKVGATYILDLEADGLLMDATRIWVIGLKDIQTGDTFAYGPEPDQIAAGLRHIMAAGKLIGHNLSLYDLPLLQRLHGLQWEDMIVEDTMIWSRLQSPDRLGGHGLEAWGKTLGCAKGDFKDFSKFSPEMVDYCMQDLEVTHKLHTKLRNVAQEYQRACEIEHKFAYIISQQILNGFRLDVEKATTLLQELQNEYNQLVDTLSKIMPSRRIEGAYNTCRADGRLISEDETGYNYTTPKTGILKFAEWKYEEPNPGSRKQIVDWLKQKYGWVPTVFTDKGQVKLDKDVFNSLPYPEAPLLSRMYHINKQISAIDGKGGWLKFLKGDRVHGSVITNGAVTGRCTHSKPNLANVAKDPALRSCWIAKEGWDLVSCDASGLEIRVIAHFVAKYDGGILAKRVVSKDIHNENKALCNLQGRDSAKTLLYGGIYGGSPKKVGAIVREDPTYENDPRPIEEIGEDIKERMSYLFDGVERLLKQLGLVISQRKYVVGLDGRKIPLRKSRKADKYLPSGALNSVAQGCGALIMKLYYINFWNNMKEEGYAHGVDYGLVANVHDENLYECRPEISDHTRDISNRAIQLVEEELDFKTKLEMGFGKGQNWSEIH